MKTPIKAHVLCYDSKSKCQMFEEFLGEQKLIKVVYVHDPDKALNELKMKKPDILLLGGDVGGSGAGAFYQMAEEWNLHRNICTYITTWDTNEAELLRRLTPRSSYVPFCQSLTNIVKERCRQIRSRKRKARNGENLPKE